MKKNLVFTPHFYPENQILNDLIFSNNENHEFTIVTSFPNYPDRKQFKDYKIWKDLYSKKFQNIKIIRLPVIYRKKNNLFFLFLNYLSLLISSLVITPALLLKRYDNIFIYLTSPIFIAISPLIINFIRRTKMNIWVLDLWPDTLEYFQFPLKKFTIKKIFQLSQILYSRCNNIFISSQGFAESKSLINFQKKIQFAPQWVRDNTQVLKSNKFKIPTKNKNNFNILFAGNMGKAQNLNNLLKAIKITSDDIQINWLFVGDGSECDSFKKQIIKNNLNKNVFFYGQVHHSYLNNFYENSNAFLVTLVDSPSINKVLPSRIINFLNYGKPVLTLASGEVSKFVQKNNLGLTAMSNEYNKLADNIRTLKNYKIDQLIEIKQNSNKTLEKVFNKNKIIDLIVTKSF
tara:strand:- start:1221 stop:2426 length:1206 start_codon:yes stop_codon:yes gene_type:complete